MLRVIGDIHGDYAAYRKCIGDAEYSLQVGDLGFNYKPLSELGLNKTKHRFIGGNHDNYDTYYECSMSLGNHGSTTLGGIQFFFIRGAFSVDWRQRVAHQITTGYKSWWEHEQLNQKQMEDALKEYCRAKPDIMITHTCPSSVAKRIGNPQALRNWGYDPDNFTTRTQELLQTCLYEHRPKLWLYGHMHQHNITKINTVEFVGLDINQCADIVEGPVYNII